MNDKQPTTTGRVRTRREVLRRHRRERQIVVFGILIIALGTVAFSAASIYSGRTKGPFTDPIITLASNVDSTVNLPCPPDILPLDPDRVKVRVLNGSGVAGIAGNTLDKLTGRGFVSGGANNWSRGKYDGAVRISFGDEGVAEAYTVARHFVDYEMVQDQRKGHSVDVVIGLAFSEVNSLRPQFAPELSKDLYLAAPGQCIQPSEVVEEPAPRVYPADLPPVEPSPSATASPDVVTDNGNFND